MGWWEGGRSNPGSGSRGHLWKAFVLNLQWEVPPLFWIQHPETSPAFPEICATELFWGLDLTGREAFSELSMHTGLGAKRLDCFPSRIPPT